MRSVAENVWLLTYPLSMLGAQFHRYVTVIRLPEPSEALVIHSTGPFTDADAAEILALGKPMWLVEAMAGHDTFSREGHDAFPTVPFLAPEDFDKKVDFPVDAILPAPVEWQGVLDVMLVEGVPAYNEYVFFHRPSRTLIVADLLFNFEPGGPLWTELMANVAIGTHHSPGMSRPFKLAVKDEAAFKRSMQAMLMWDFDRVIVGHGEPIETGGKAKVTAMLKAEGFLE